MADKYEVTVLPSGILFHDRKRDKVETENFLEAMPLEDAMKVLIQDAKERKNVTRAWLSHLVQILQSPTLDTYKGKQQPPERVDNNFKAELRRLEEEYFRPQIVKEAAKKSKDVVAHQKAWDDWSAAELREPGVYQTVRQTCIKFFAYMGRLPCAVEDKTGKPDLSKLLSVSAMNRLIENAPRHQGAAEENSIAARIGELQERMKKNKATINDGALQVIRARLEQFLQDIREIQNERNVAATAAREGKATAEQVSMLTAAGAGMPQPQPTTAPVTEPAGRAEDQKPTEVGPISDAIKAQGKAKTKPAPRKMSKAEHAATAQV